MECEIIKIRINKKQKAKSKKAKSKKAKGKKAKGKRQKVKRKKFGDVLELLYTRNLDYDAVCAMDYYYQFYDFFATRDIHMKRNLPTFSPLFLLYLKAYTINKIFLL